MYRFFFSFTNIGPVHALIHKEMNREIFTVEEDMLLLAEQTFTALLMTEVEGISVIYALLGAVCCH